MGTTKQMERHLARREVATMVIYVAVVLMAAIVALPSSKLDGATVAAAIWGAAIGLAVAHWFAFHMSAQLFAGGRVRREDVIEGAVNAIAALVVALIATIPLIFTAEQTAATASVLTLAGIVALVGYVASRRAGLPHHVALFRAFVTVALGVVVVVLKAALTH